MSDEIIKVLNNLGEKFGMTIDWTSQNVMPYLQDLMNRFIGLQNAKAIVWMVISLIVLIVLIIIIVKTIKHIKKLFKEKYDYGDRVFWYSLVWMFGGFLIIVFLAVLFGNLFGLFQNIYTPEITLLEYITNYGGI